MRQGVGIVYELKLKEMSRGCQGMEWKVPESGADECRCQRGPAAHLELISAGGFSDIQGRGED